MTQLNFLPSTYYSHDPVLHIDMLKPRRRYLREEPNKIFLQDYLLIYMATVVVLFCWSQGLQSSPYSPWVARALGRSGLGSQVVKAVTVNARDVGFNPHLFQPFPIGCLGENCSLIPNKICLEQQYKAFCWYINTWKKARRQGDHVCPKQQ